MRRFGTWAAVVAALAVAAAGCGGGGSSSPIAVARPTTTVAGSAPGSPSTTPSTSTPATAVPKTGSGAAASLGAAYEKTVAAGSSRLSLRETVQLGTKRLTVSGSGEFNYSPSAGIFTIQSNASPASGRINERIIGSQVYVELPASERSAIGGKQWLEVSGVTSTSSSGSSPTQALALLEGSATGVHKVGTQTIGGVPTTEYRGTVDFTKEAAHLTPLVRQLLKTFSSSLGLKAIPVAVWVDSAGRARQIAESFTIPSSATGALAAAAGSRVSTIIQLSDYGVAVHVVAPPPSEVSRSPVGSTNA